MKGKDFSVDRIDSIMLQLEAHGEYFKEFGLSKDEAGKLVLLGSGGEASVYEAYERSTGKAFALRVQAKVLGEDVCKDVYGVYENYDILRDLREVTPFIQKIIDQMEIVVDG